MGRRRENRLSLYRRGRVFWVAASDPVAGKVRAMSLRETQLTLARARHQVLQEAWRRGEQIFPGAPSRGEARGIREALDQFLDFRKGRVAGSTWVNDRYRLLGFAAAFDGAALRSLTRKKIEDWLTGILNRGTRANHNQYLTIARKFLAWCCSHNLIFDNPAGHLKPLKLSQEPIEFLTIAERGRVLAAAARTRYGSMVATALHCGLRLGELQRLRWEDLDLAGRTLMVREAKSGRPRQVPMPRALVEILRQAARKARGQGLCFPVHVPACLPENYRHKHAGDRVEGTLKEYLAEISATARVKFNWLIARHTFGSLLAQKGVSLLKISKWMGHQKPETTVRHYATLAPGWDEDVEV